MPLWSRRSVVRKKSTVDRSSAAQINALLVEVVAATGLGNLPTRVPCLKDIVETIRIEIKKTFSCNSIDYLNEHEAFANSIANLEKRCRLVLDLLVHTPVAILADPRSSKRTEVLKHTLVLNHIQRELMAEFTDGKWNESVSFKLEQARTFWRQMFGKSHVVTWSHFLDAMKIKFGADYLQGDGAKEFKEHVDVCEDGLVSWWEFDIFTQLYQPWGRIMNTWYVVTKKHPGYKAWMTYEEVQQVMQPLMTKPGSYCFRLSVTKPGMWAIGFVNCYGTVLQALPPNKSLYQALIDGAADGTYRYPMGLDINIDPREHMAIDDSTRVNVTEEQHEIYMKIDSRFELCKICHTSRKNLRIEPCDHLLCRKCFDDWNTSQRAECKSTKCPFCRGRIENTVTIEVTNSFSAAAAPAAPAAPAEPPKDRRSRRERDKRRSFRERAVSTSAAPGRSSVHAAWNGIGGTGTTSRRRNSDEFVTIAELNEFRRRHTEKQEQPGNGRARTSSLASALEHLSRSRTISGPASLASQHDASGSRPPPEIGDRDMHPMLDVLGSRRSCPVLQADILSGAPTEVDADLEEAIRRSLLDSSSSFTSEMPSITVQLSQPSPLTREVLGSVDGPIQVARTDSVDADQPITSGQSCDLILPLLPGADIEWMPNLSLLGQPRTQTVPDSPPPTPVTAITQFIPIDKADAGTQTDAQSDALDAQSGTPRDMQTYDSPRACSVVEGGSPDAHGEPRSLAGVTSPPVQVVNNGGLVRPPDPLPDRPTPVPAVSAAFVSGSAWYSDNVLPAGGVGSHASSAGVTERMSIGEMEPRMVVIVPEGRRSLPRVPATGTGPPDGLRSPLPQTLLPSNAGTADSTSDYVNVDPDQPVIDLAAPALDQAVSGVSDDALRDLPVDQLLALLARQTALTAAATRQAEALAKEKVAVEALLADSRNDIAVMVAGDHVVSSPPSTTTPITSTPVGAGPVFAVVAVGDRVLVTGAPVGTGTVRFVGYHHVKGDPQVGVELDNPVGMNNGTIGRYTYFECPEDHGLLLSPRQIEPLLLGPPSLRDPDPAALARHCAELTAANAVLTEQVAPLRTKNEEISLLLDEKEQFIFWFTERAKQLCPEVLDRNVVVLEGPPRRRSSGLLGKFAVLDLDTTAQSSLI